LPELVARSDQAVAAPRRRPARSKTKQKRASRRRILPAFLLAHPGRTAACAVVAAVLTGIVLNAAFFQNGRHPAPLFASAPTVQPRAARSEVPVPSPRPADVAVPSSAGLVPPASIPAPTPGHAAVPAPSPAPRTTLAKAEVGEPKRDAIGAFLKGDGGTETPDRVSAAQKALMRVGYVLRADGVMGTGTRKIIEQFQRENDLSVTGDLNARTLRELTAQSGVAIP
jgi:hypothetical protein